MCLHHNHDHHHDNHKPKEFDDEFLEWEERDDTMPYLTHCAAGSIAGITEHVTMLPVDTIKTHMQVLDKKYTAFETAQRLYKTEGLSKFWRGASVLASGCVPAHAVYFSVYEFSKNKLLPKFHDSNNQIYPYAYALTGALATSMHDLILTPFDVMKQRSQLAPSGLSSPWALLQYIVKNEGILSLYRSYPITVFMNMPQAAAIVSVNETLKVLYRPEKGHNILSYFMCAGVAGSAAAVMTIPLDNIKTRLQTQTFFSDSRREPEKAKVSTHEVKQQRVGIQMNIAPAKSFFATAKESVLNTEREIKYRDVMSTIRTIIREEGFRGFYKGLVPRVIAQAPASAISWTAYETIKKVLTSKKLY